MQGFRIPALTTRRAETDVELRDGQSFVIGGLMNNLSQNDRASIPILGDVPIIGYLFKSRAERKERTELIVIITPRLIQPLNAEPPLPIQPQQFLPPRSGKDTGPSDGSPVANDAAGQAGAPAKAPTICLDVWCR